MANDISEYVRTGILPATPVPARDVDRYQLNPTDKTKSPNVPLFPLPQTRKIPAPAVVSTTAPSTFSVEAFMAAARKDPSLIHALRQAIDKTDTMTEIEKLREENRILQERIAAKEAAKVKPVRSYEPVGLDIERDDNGVAIGGKLTFARKNAANGRGRYAGFDHSTHNLEGWEVELLLAELSDK